MDPGCCSPDLTAQVLERQQAATSAHKTSRGRSRLAERRYTAEPESPDKSFEVHEKEFSLSKLTSSLPQNSKPPSILRLPGLKPADSHQRRRSHHRQKSIYFSAETTYDQVIEELEKENLPPPTHPAAASPAPTKPKAHIRTISDADSVVYTGPVEEQILQDSLEAGQPLYRQSTNSTVKGLGDRETMEVLEELYEKENKAGLRPLPILGSLPCSAYCQKCGMDVHTVISFDLSERSLMSSTLITLFSPVLSCCEVPMWLNKLKVHRCSICHIAVARSA